VPTVTTAGTGKAAIVRACKAKSPNRCRTGLCPEGMNALRARYKRIHATNTRALRGVSTKVSPSFKNVRLFLKKLELK
jgi:hypothetical protein